MATLTTDDLSLEIAYRDFEDGWVHYDIWLRWQGEPVLNDAILKRHSDYWAKRGYGAIAACEQGECEILPLLRKVLETNVSDYWEGTDPDVLLALYTGEGFPFLPSKWTLLRESPTEKARQESRAATRAESGPLPDDLVEMILFVDVYNFEGATAYHGSGPCFRLTPTRAELQMFYADLRGEYVAFRERHGVASYNHQHWGQALEEPWF